MLSLIITKRRQIAALLMPAILFGTGQPVMAFPARPCRFNIPAR
jgi:hypothetical protein